MPVGIWQPVQPDQLTGRHLKNVYRIMYLGRKTRASGSNRVKRGGSWNNDGTNLRSAKRNNNTPGNRNNNIGFRVGFRVGLSGMDFSQSQAWKRVLVPRRRIDIRVRKTPLWDEPVEEMSRVKHSESLLHGCLSYFF